MQQDTKTSLFRSARHFFSGTLLSRITGLLRDITMAFAFGTGGTVAAFFVAFRFAHLLRRLFGEGAFQSAFIPLFEELRHESPKRAYQFFRDLYTALLLVLALIIFCSMATLWGIFHLYSLGEENQDILLLTCIMAPSLLFICLFGLNSSFLQCEKHFFIPSIAPVAFNVVWIIGVLALWKLRPHFPMAWLAGIVIVASCGQWLMTLPKTIHILKKNQIKKLWGSPLSSTLFLLNKPLLLGMVGVASSQVNNALDVVFARYAAIDGPALLWYAIRIQQLPLALFGITLSGALLPPLTRALHAKNFLQYHSFLRYSIRQCLWIMIPMTLVLLLLGKQVIGWIYCRGLFSGESVTETTYCLWAYSLGLIPMSLVLILAPVYYSQKNYLVPATSSACCMLFNISLNSWLVIGLKLGPASVALATSLCAWINFLMLYRGEIRNLGNRSVPLILTAKRDNEGLI